MRPAHVSNEMWSTAANGSSARSEIDAFSLEGSSISSSLMPLSNAEREGVDPDDWLLLGFSDVF